MGDPNLHDFETQCIRFVQRKRKLPPDATLPPLQEHFVRSEEVPKEIEIPTIQELLQIWAQRCKSWPQPFESTLAKRLKIQLPSFPLHKTPLPPEIYKTHTERMVITRAQQKEMRNQMCPRATSKKKTQVLEVPLVRVIDLQAGIKRIQNGWTMPEMTRKIHPSENDQYDIQEQFQIQTILPVEPSHSVSWMALNGGTPIVTQLPDRSFSKIPNFVLEPRQLVADNLDFRLEHFQKHEDMAVPALDMPRTIGLRLIRLLSKDIIPLQRELHWIPRFAPGTTESDQWQCVLDTPTDEPPASRQTSPVIDSPIASFLPTDDPHIAIPVKPKFSYQATKEFTESDFKVPLPVKRTAQPAGDASSQRKRLNHTNADELANHMNLRHQQKVALSLLQAQRPSTPEPRREEHAEVSQVRLSPIQLRELSLDIPVELLVSNEILINQRLLKELEKYPTVTLLECDSSFQHILLGSRHCILIGTLTTALDLVLEHHAAFAHITIIVLLEADQGVVHPFNYTTPILNDIAQLRADFIRLEPLGVTAELLTAFSQAHVAHTIIELAQLGKYPPQNPDFGPYELFLSGFPSMNLLSARYMASMYSIYDLVKMSQEELLHSLEENIAPHSIIMFWNHLHGELFSSSGPVQHPYIR